MTGTRLAVLALAVLVSGCISRMPPVPVAGHGPARTEARARPAAAPPAAPATQASVAAPDGFYVVRRGDTLYSIALEHGADYREVAQWNALDDATKIRVGQLLRVSPPENRRIEVGAARVPGRIEARPIEASPSRAPAVAPRAEPAVRIAKPEVDAAGFTWPAKGKVIAGFSEPRNKGIDIDGKPGDPVVAAAPGRVTYIGNGIPGLGKLVVIKHDNGFITVYAHNRDIVVKEQQTVARGEKIAELGSTDAERPKLHFQIRKGSAPVDPMRYLPGL